MRKHVSLIVAVCRLVVGISAEETPLPTGAPGNASFDYVVIGGGTAGLALASRLSVSASVAVIEAGGLYEQDNGNLSIVPYNARLMGFLDGTEAYPPQPLMDWDLLSTPQSAAGNRRIHYAQGKTLGGSSAINSMGYHRATRGAFQLWADTVGDQSYAFDRVFPYFKRTCTLTPPDLEKRNAPNATVLYDLNSCDNTPENPLQVSWSNWVDPAQSWLARALQAVGQTLSPMGLNSGELNGGAWIPNTIDPKNVTRSTSKNSYLEYALEQQKRARITIYLRSQASKILFDGKKKAIGVAVSSGSQQYVLSAKKEVILSAGVFHSPQILMLSGIGPASTLSNHSIQVISDLPGVGQNLRDQVFFGLSRGINVPNTGTYLASPAQRDFALQQYRSNGSGPYSAGAAYLSFEKLPAKSLAGLSNRTLTLLSQFPSDWPNIEYVPVGFGSPIPNITTIGGFGTILLTPSSRGTVTIQSASISDPPIIDLGWLTDAADGETLVAAFKRVREAWSSSAVANITVGPEISPGEAVTSDADILDYIRQTVQTIWHASSTCAMGKAGDRFAVVDSKARVFGVKNLRIVDNSIPPFGLPGHPQSSVYMLAEKIADDILEGR